MSKPRIDFVTPIPLITCLARLPRGYIHPTGKGEYNFETPLEIYKGSNKGFRVRLNLSSQDAGTHITGGVFITRFMYIVLTLWTILAFINTGIVGIPDIGLPIVIGIASLQLLFVRYQRHFVEKQLSDVFRDFKHKKQMFTWWERLVFPAIKLQREVPLSQYDLTNKLYRLHYETDYVQMRERKERYFIINHNGARIFGWMRVIDSEVTAVQYWIGFDLLGLSTSLLIVSLFCTFFFIPTFWELPLDNMRDFFIMSICFFGVFIVITSLFQCIGLWRKFRTTLNTVELKAWSLLQDLH